MTPEPTVVDGSVTDSASNDSGSPRPVDFKPDLDQVAHVRTRNPAPEVDNGSLPLLLAFVAVIIALGAVRTWWIPGIIAGLLFMLFMHELGHYVTARASGMKVTEFFLGFGPKIWSFNRGETEYGVKAIPAGAYVRIMGMTNLDEIDPAEEDRTYRAQPYWQRMMTICAGSAMHFLMAFVALVVLFGGFGYQGFDGPPWVVSQVVPGSSADALGVEVGDRIVEFDGAEFVTWDDFAEVVTSTDVGPVEVVVERDGERLVLGGELGARSGDVVGGGFGLVINEDRASQGWTVEHVLAGSNAADFGVEPGDILLRAGSVGRPSQMEFGQILVAAEGEQLELSLRRGERTQVVSGTVELDRTIGFRGFFGVGPEWPEQPDATWGESFGRAADDFGTVARTNLVGLIDLIDPTKLAGLFDDDEGEPAAAPSASPGPIQIVEPEDPGNRPVSMIGIARLFAESESVDQVLFLFMLVNIFIGIFNLLPLLPLDGGHAAIATYERARGLITRRPHRVDAAKLIPITWGVMVLLITVGLWAAALDVFAWPA